MADDALFEWSGGEPPSHPGQSLGQFLLEKMRLHAAANTRPAQIDASGAAKSYLDLLREGVQAAAGWRALGVSSSDTVAIFTRNNHFKYTALLGALLEGITMATFVPTAKEDELRLLLSRADIKVMVCEPANLQVALAVLPPAVSVFVTAEAADPSWPRGVRAMPELLQRGVDVDAYRAAEVGDPHQHVAFIAFSSGTTGLPKGVAITNYAVMLNIITGFWRVQPEDQVLVTSPVSWITGIMYTVVPIAQGATRVLYTYTTEEEYLDILRRFKITMAFLAPARYMLLASLVKSLRKQNGGDPDKLPPRLRYSMAGGAAMTAEVQQACSEALGTPISQVFGCTETLLLCSDVAQPPRYGSVGKLAPGVRARLVDIHTGCNVREPNVEGELRLKTPSFMLGYVRDPETTAKAIDEQGWYRADGYLYITGRIKELLKFMNMEMAPGEIEGVLVSHPAVKSACVVGRPHQVVGDIPTAFVVLLPGKQATEQELQELVKARLSQNKQLRGGVFFVDEVPLTLNGKYDRNSLTNRLKKLPPVSDDVLGLTRAV